MAKIKALYVRTSTDMQANGLDSQVRALTAYCSERNYGHYEVYEDFAQSGAKLVRPGLDRLMRDLRSGRVDMVIVYSFSRFARSTTHLLSALEEMNSLGVSFVSYSESLDTSTAMGRTMFTIIASLSELERALIQERVVNGLKAAKARGKKLGRNKSVNTPLILELHSRGLKMAKIASLANCSVSSVHREVTANSKIPISA